MDRFERQMGPALREGYWQPEDYTDYGTVVRQDMTQVSGYEKVDSKPYWDTELYDDEQNIYYEEGTDQSKIYYPIFDLSSDKFTDINKLAFVYYEPQYLIDLYQKASSFNNGYDNLTAKQKKEI